ncbi:MAG: hypothetical protein M0Z79_13035 [Nitrospiraceae bacterium]|nr:hypothetical protein [Nitrospiraceae bacterium]
MVGYHVNCHEGFLLVDVEDQPLFPMKYQKGQNTEEEDNPGEEDPEKLSFETFYVDRPEIEAAVSMVVVV